MGTDHRLVELKNVLDNEGYCSCGCGKGCTPELLVTLQAFVYVLERKYGLKTRVFWSGARCQKKNDATKGAAQYSLHLTGEAADCRFEQYDGARWEKIPSVQVAALAISSGLWGGVGYKKYLPKPGHVHLDVRSGKNPVVW